MGRLELSPSVPPELPDWEPQCCDFRFAEEKLFGLVDELGWTQRGWKRRLQESPLQYSRTLTYINMLDYDTDNLWLTPLQGFINLGPEGLAI